MLKTHTTSRRDVLRNILGYSLYHFPYSLPCACIQAFTNSLCITSIVSVLLYVNNIGKTCFISLLMPNVHEQVIHI